MSGTAPRPDDDLPALATGAPVPGDGTLSPEARARLARATGPNSPEPGPPPWDDHAAVRGWRAAQHAAWGEGTEVGEPAHVPVEVASVAGLEAGPSDGPTLLYLHGGAHVLGSPGVAAPITARLAAGLHVISVDYRLAPEHPFPAALHDALAVYQALAAAGGVVVAGDSAGGGLAVALALVAGREGSALPRPAGLALLCPFLDHAGPGPARHGAAGANEAGDPSTMSAAYLAGHSPTDPLASPARAAPADLARLPPTLLQTGTRDALFRQAVTFARRARAAGAPLTLDVWHGLWHTWHYHRELPESHRALAEVVAFVRSAASTAAMS